MLLSGRHTGELTELVWKLRLKFAMKDLGLARHILGMKISRNRAKRQLGTCLGTLQHAIGQVCFDTAPH